MKPPSKHRRSIVREQLANPQRTKSRAQIAASARAWRKIQRRTDAAEIAASLATARQP